MQHRGRSASSRCVPQLSVLALGMEVKRRVIGHCFTAARAHRRRKLGVASLVALVELTLVALTIVAT